ncbi:MAG: tRNA 2-thiouridine(34) synthase MnmA [Deferribacteraceae bacterium]|jgi:tRNA-specific 2-thiouridylase|nr:tRNA 2-thiouridine(34) synthase MnmA [Deferribacteraceae bacterium]
MDSAETANKITEVFTPGEKVLVAMSGGVDSSVAAWAAKRAGCDVTGVTLWLYDTPPDTEPFWKDAEKMAGHLEINWYLADYRQYFNEDIISPYIATYKKGETPNPCCVCNRTGKTKYLFNEMQRAKATRIVTGHYACLGYYNDRKVIIRSAAQDKDQSYYLCLMDPFHIQLMLYPLSCAESKEDVRNVAAELNLPTAQKRDSYEACFLMGQDYREFLHTKIGEGKQGQFIFNGKELGRHKGTFHYTVGQRRGLDISHEEPLYVKQIDPENGAITLSEKGDLLMRGVRLRGCIFDQDEPTVRRCYAQLRHKMKAALCILEIQQQGNAVLLFDEPQFAPAPGQITALYEGLRLMGGGVVDSVF